MIILQLTTPELLAVLFALALLIFAGVIASYSLGAGSVNIDLEVKRRVKSTAGGGFRAPPPPTNNDDLAKSVNLYDGYKLIRAELDVVSSVSLIKYTKLKKSNLINRTPPFYVMSMEKFLLAAIISNHPLGQKDELLASLKLFEIANGLMELILAETQLPTSLDYSVLEDEIKKRRNAL